MGNATPISAEEMHQDRISDGANRLTRFRQLASFWAQNRTIVSRREFSWTPFPDYTADAQPGCCQDDRRAKMLPFLAALCDPARRL